MILDQVFQSPGPLSLDYRPENAEQNFKLISSQVSKLHNGKITHVGNVKMVIGGLENPKKRKRVAKALKKAFSNVQVEEKDDRLVVKTGFKKKQVLAHIKQKAPQQLLADLRWQEPLLNPVPTPKPKNALLKQALLEKVVIKPQQQKKDVWSDVLQKMDDLKKHSQKQQADKRVQGVGNMFQQAQAQVAAKQWEKQLQEQQRVHNIKRKFQPVVKQLLEKPVRLRVVDDHGADQWARQLQHQARVAQLHQAVKPVHQQLRKLVKKVQNVVPDPQEQRREKIKKALKHPLKEIRKGTGVHRLRPVDKGAQKWSQQLSDQKCKSWQGDKSHNPFNKTNRGPILHPGSPVFKQIAERCEDKQKFCKKVFCKKTKHDKYC